MPNSTKKCLTKSEISKIGPDYDASLSFDTHVYIHIISHHYRSIDATNNKFK